MLADLRGLARTGSEAADLRAKLELTERTDSSQREALEQRLEPERLLRAEAERERDELRTQLEALHKTPQAPESAAEEPTGHTLARQRGSGRRSQNADGDVGGFAGKGITIRVPG